MQHIQEMAAEHLRHCEYAEALDSGSKRAGVDAGVPGKSGKK